MDVPCQLHAIGNDGMTAYLAIMGNVHVGHNPVVTANAGHAHILHGAGVDRHIFAYCIIITDLQSGGFSSVFFVLWNTPDGAKSVKQIIFTDGGMTINNTMRPDLGACIYFDMLTNNTVEHYLNRGIQLSSRCYHNCWMDKAHAITLLLLELLI